MPTYPHHLHLKMDPDDRLAAAAGGAVRCLGDTAGLPTEEIVLLQSAVLAACKKCFGTQTTGKVCEIDMRRTENRIHVEVRVPECTPPADKDKLKWPGVDEVECEARGEAGILRLTKFVKTRADAD